MANQQPIKEFFTRKITLVIPTWASLILIVIASALIAWFIFVPTQRQEAIFVTSVLVGIGVFLNATNAIFARQAQAEQAGRALQTQTELADSSKKESRRREALDLMKGWNDPAFTTIRHRIAIGFEKNETFITIESSIDEQAQVNYVLNFLEMIAIACKSGDADMDLCKLFFRSALLYYKNRLGRYIQDWRTTRKQPTAFEHLWTLANSWET